MARWDPYEDTPRLTGMLIGARSVAYLFAKLLCASSSDVPSTADNIFSVIFHAYLSWLAVTASLELGGDVVSRWHGTSDHSQLYLLLFVIDNTIHIPLQLCKSVPPSKSVSVIVHHLLSNACYLMSLRLRRMQFWAALAGVSEATNPLLSALFILKELDCVDGPWKRVYRLTSLSLWLSFVVLRIVLYPLWLFYFTADALSQPADTVSKATFPELILYPVVVIVMLALSINWLVPLTAGTVKVATGSTTQAIKDRVSPKRKGRASGGRGAPRSTPTTEKRGNQFSRAQGASSGSETWLIAAVLLALLMWAARASSGGRTDVALAVPASLFAVQVLAMSSLSRSMLYVYCCSLRLGPANMRNAVLGFAQCVRPGGRPTATHCLSMYNLPAPLTAGFYIVTASILITLGPIAALVRVFYPEHTSGVNAGRYSRLYLFFLRHPLTVQGEGPSNGDGLSSLCSSESLIYPITPRELEQGPTDHAYWLGPTGEGKPRFRDMFHDKIFCHRFFRAHGVACPVLVAEVEADALVRRHVPRGREPQELIWKPRYSTMGLGVEHFPGWHGHDAKSSATPVGTAREASWAPSGDPYLIEEFVRSTEYEMSEWYRCVTLWAYDEEQPKHSYIWRMRNQKGDHRVQTDIMGGAYCVTSAFVPFVGPTKGGYSFDPRTGASEPLDPQVHRTLTAAISQMVMMHTVLGQEVYSVGWDVLVRGSTPVFIEFNLGNGFFLADHSVEECEQLAAFFEEQFYGRVDRQLYEFDPEAAPVAAGEITKACAKTPTTADTALGVSDRGRRPSKSPRRKKLE
jgi:hypothetical protein